MRSVHVEVEKNIRSAACDWVFYPRTPNNKLHADKLLAAPIIYQ